MNTLERLVPNLVVSEDITGQQSLKLHLARYEFATKHLCPGRLLDIACGVGYGTRFMVDKNKAISEAVGVDISSEALEYAEKNYKKSHIQFKKSDALTFSDAQGFDSIVCFETIEHMKNPAELLKRLVGMLHPGGVLIVSAPTTLSTDINPYHLSNFTETSFRRLGRNLDLKEVISFKQTQPYSFLNTVRRKEKRIEDMRKNLPAYYSSHPWVFLLRLLSVLRYGFTNHYLTVVWKR